MRKLFAIVGISPFLRPFVTSSLHRNVCATQSNKLVIVDKFKAVTILSLNRPDKQNALNEALLQELAAQLTRFEADSSASVVVINGIGGNFSAGYDIDELKEKSECNPNAVRSSLILPFQRKTGKPFVCGISGQCKSIGLELALMCDIRYVEQKAVLGFNNRKLGIPLLNGGPKRLANIIGTSKAIDFIGMDRQVNADEAVELGLANGVVQDGTVLGSAMKTAVFLSSLPQSALQHDLALLNEIDTKKFTDTDRWASILDDVKANINLNDETMKSTRISKLKNMADWELDEIEHEQNYVKKMQNQKKVE